MMESKQKSMFVQFALEPLWKVRNPRVRRFCRGILKEGLQGLHWIGAPPPLAGRTGHPQGFRPAAGAQGDRAEHAASCPAAG